MMKNKPTRYAAAICAAAALAVLPGCEKSGDSNLSVIESSTVSDIGNEVERISISVVRDTFEDEIKVLKSKKTDNIFFEDLKTYSFPDINEITTYKVERLADSGTKLTSAQFFENFVSYCEYLAPGKYTKDDIAEQCIVQGNFEQNPDEGWYNYNDFKDINKDGDLKISYMELCTSDLYLSYLGNCCPYIYNSGTFKLRDKINDDSFALFHDAMSNGRTIIDYTENINSDDVYHLVDGDISISDAAGKTNALLADIAKQCDDGSDCLQKVCAVKVMDIGEGCHGYCFTTTPVIDGINYSFYDMRSDRGSVGTFVQEGIDADPSFDDAIMIESDKICEFFWGYEWTDKRPIETYYSIVTLESAAESASKLLSREMRFKAKSVTLVYDIKDGTDDLVPCWRFLLENTANQKQYYHVYVNALTGEARVKAIQEVNSGYEYD